MFRRLGMTTHDWALLLGKTDSSSFSNHLLPIALHLGWGLWNLYVGMEAGGVIMQVLFIQAQCWDFMGAASLSSLEDNIS